MPDNTRTTLEYAVEVVGRGFLWRNEGGRPGVVVRDQPQQVTHDIAWAMLREAEVIYRGMGIKDLTVRVIVRTCTITTERGTWSTAPAKAVNHV